MVLSLKRHRPACWNDVAQAAHRGRTHGSQQTRNRDDRKWYQGVNCKTHPIGPRPPARPHQRPHSSQTQHHPLRTKFKPMSLWEMLYNHTLMLLMTLPGERKTWPQAVWVLETILNLPVLGRWVGMGVTVFLSWIVFQWWSGIWIWTGPCVSLYIQALSNTSTPTPTYSTPTPTWFFHDELHLPYFMSPGALTSFCT